MAAEYFRTTEDECPATPVLDHIAFKKGARASNYIYTKMSSTTPLKGVASQVAHTCGAALDSDAPAAAVDGESLHGHAARVLDIHNC